MRKFICDIGTVHYFIKKESSVSIVIETVHPHLIIEIEKLPFGIKPKLIHGDAQKLQKLFKDPVQIIKLFEKIYNDCKKQYVS